VSAWIATDDGLTLAIRVTPRGGRDTLGAGTPDHFAARLAAAPVDGRANIALLALVAATFGVARRDVALVGGATARLKRVRITGDVTTLAKTAATLYAPAP